MHSFPEEYTANDGVYYPRQSEDLKNFLYSDGEDFEKKIGDIISQASDRSLFSKELLDAIWDWRSGCHLSPVRTNILRPLEDKCKGRVLELGSGCGIITRYLGEIGADVVALEASTARVAITRARTADLENVKVVCDRIEDFHSETKFDVVTLIGVLQYARLFSKCGANAEIQLLENSVRQLNDDGVLVISIQNKLGLKYFAGYPEANVGLPFYGIEGRYGPETIVRFGLQEVKDLLASIGLSHQEILLPLPDYHMPTSILAPSAIKESTKFSAAPLLVSTAGRDRARPDWDTPSFSLERAWESVNSAGLTEGLSNAFLIVAGKTEQSLSFLRDTKALAWHYSLERHAQYATSKCFINKDENLVVSRKLVAPSHGVTDIETPIIHHVKNEDYFDGPLLWSSLVDIVNNPDWSSKQIGQWAARWINSLCAHAGVENNLDLSIELAGKLFDCTPMNCIDRGDGHLQFFDMEWEVNRPLRLSYLIIRGMFGSLVSISSCAPAQSGTSLRIIQLIWDSLATQGYMLTESDISHFIDNEHRIQSWINKGAEGGSSALWNHYAETVKLDVRPLATGAKAHRILLEKQQALIAGQSAEIDNLKVELTQQAMLFRASFSWRITKPVRFLGGALRSLRRFF